MRTDDLLDVAELRCWLNIKEGVTSMTDSLGTSGVTSYGYDSAQRLTTIARSIGGSTVAVVGLAYDAASRVTAISRTTNGSGTNVASSLAYDSADRVTTLTHQVSGGSVLDSFVYGYDSGGRLKTETNTEGLATYGYDVANQLTSVTRPAGQTNESYSYDSGGNRTMTGYTTGVGNELLASPGATYAYDAEGNLAAKTETSTGNVWSYTYDIRNRMTGVTEKISGGTVIYQASYTYDALDRRIATNVNGTTTWTVYDGQNTYADFTGAGVLKTRYLYGPAVDALLARTDASGTTVWYLTDRLGSVRDLASTSGGLLDHLAYDAYGNIVSESQPSNGDRFKWTAREWDGKTGLQFNRHRYYAPSVGRWTQLDPIGLLSDVANLYEYGSNNSLTNSDPAGLYQEESPSGTAGRYAPSRSEPYTRPAEIKGNPLTGELEAELKQLPIYGSYGGARYEPGSGQKKASNASAPSPFYPHEQNRGVGESDDGYAKGSNPSARNDHRPVIHRSVRPARNNDTARDNVTASPRPRSPKGQNNLPKPPTLPGSGNLAPRVDPPYCTGVEYPPGYYLINGEWYLCPFGIKF